MEEQHLPTSNFVFSVLVYDLSIWKLEWNSSSLLVCSYACFPYLMLINRNAIKFDEPQTLTFCVSLQEKEKEMEFMNSEETLYWFEWKHGWSMLHSNHHKSV